MRTTPTWTRAQVVRVVWFRPPLVPPSNGSTGLKRGEPAMRFLRRRDARRNVEGKMRKKKQQQKKQPKNPRNQSEPWESTPQRVLIPRC